jgi:hypothetical protein
VLSSRALEHLGLHVDSKDGLAEAVGKHRGDMPHARDLTRDASDTGRDANPASGKTLDAERDSSRDISLEIETRRDLNKVYEIGL